MCSEAKFKKLGSHCSNAVGSHDNRRFSERCIYKTGFVNKELFDKEYIARLLSVCKKVKPSLSFAAVVKGQRAIKHAHGSPSVTRSDNRGQQSKMLGRRNAVVYVSSHYNKVVNHSSGSDLQQGVSHMGGDVCAHVENKGKQSLICKDDQVERFVHKNRFKLLEQDDTESSIEGKCQNTVSARVKTDCQVGVSPVALLVKDGSKSVKGKKTKPFNCSKLAVDSKYLDSETFSENTVTEGFPALNAVDIVTDDQLIHTRCANPSESANTAINRSLCASSVAKVLDTKGNKKPMENGYKSTVETINQIIDNSADKYALELQTSIKKDKLKVARQAHDNTLCIAQNVPLFGFISIYGLKGQVVDKCHNRKCNDMLQLHKMLREDGRYNYEGLQIPVPSKLNHKAWVQYLQEYWDWQLPLLIKFRFPLDFDRDRVINSHDINHKSATEHPDHVSVYLEEELRHQAILGPFKHPPIEKLHTSPFMTRDKPNMANRRVIIDLSWPHGNSVNAGVSSDKYLGTEFVLTYPSVDNATQEVLRLGRGCKIFKVDISRAFRHVPIDPGDLDLLGLHWGEYFIDRSLPFGFKHGSSIFQRMSDAVRFIMSQEGHGIWNYIDNLLCVSLPSKIDVTFNRLQELLQELGLMVSAKKLVPPSTRVTCLGIVVDTVALSVSIPAEKLAVIKNVCSEWASKQICTKKELQSLLGLLLYVAKCIKYARYFLNRMLMLLRDNTHCSRIRLTEDFKKDLRWFNTFLPVFNGVSIFRQPPNKSVHLDACPSGLGAIFDHQVYSLPLPSNWKDLNIAYTELINILVALKVWHTQWAGSSVLIRCDNSAVVSVLTTGKTRDPVMAKYVRNIFLWLSAFNIDMKVVHIAGCLNPVADLLSRWHLTSNNFKKLQELVHPVSWANVSVDLLKVNESI